MLRGAHPPQEKEGDDEFFPLSIYSPYFFPFFDSISLGMKFLFRGWSFLCLPFLPSSLVKAFLFPRPRHEFFRKAERRILLLDFLSPLLVTFSPLEWSFLRRRPSPRLLPFCNSFPADDSAFLSLEIIKRLLFFFFFPVDPPPFYPLLFRGDDFLFLC